jgi:segregation and condensation protein A
MGDLSFRLEAFEGPLDLLLHLISKHKLNIEDIEISLLLEQYLSYIEGLSEQDMEQAGEFLEMAARLIFIKTVSLLPRHEEAEEIKKELEGRLIEYSLCKRAAELLKERYIGGDIFVREPLKIEIDKTYAVIHQPTDLIAAFQGISVRDRMNLPPEASEFRPIVSKRIVSVTSKIIYVLKRLYNGESCKINELFKGMSDRSERIATFLAILELSKSGRVVLNDDNTEIIFLRRQKVIS